MVTGGGVGITAKCCRELICLGTAVLFCVLKGDLNFGDCLPWHQLLYQSEQGTDKLNLAMAPIVVRFETGDLCVF